MSIQIAGFSDSVKIPGFFAETVYNAGAITAASIPLVLLLCGTMTSSGSAVPNQDVIDIFSTGDANAAFGPGSDLAIQCYGALQTAGVSIKAAPVPEAGGSVAASAVINITGSWTVGGTLSFRIDGITYTANALSTDTPTTFGTTVEAAVNGNGNGSCAASNSAGTVTLTRKSKGLRGNQGALYINTGLLPSGMEVGIAGGTNTTVAAGSNTKVLPQTAINVTSVSSLPSSGTVYDSALNTSIAYTGTQTATATTIAAGSNTKVLPQASIAVASVSGWPTTGKLCVTALGAFVSYTGTQTAPATTIAAGSDTKALPQASIVVASVSGWPTTGELYLPAIDSTVAYTGTQTAPATSVSVGSNGVNVNTFAGAGVLNVTSNASYPTAGFLYLPGVDATITYTGLGVNTFTGCTTLGGAAGVLTTGDAVDGTLFTGCSGGTGTLATGDAVDGTLFTGCSGGTGTLATGQAVDGKLLTGCSGGTGTLATGQVIYEVDAMTGQGVHFTGGVGTESVSTLIANVIQALQYDRIAPAQNDAVNAAAWEAFVNSQAQPLVGITEHLIFAENGTFASAVSLGQTTLNAERAQLLWQNDGETYPPFVCATFGAIRTSTEQGDPDAAYDGLVLPGVAPQSQKSDWPNTNTQIAALNSGVTPVTTNADGQSVIVRSITSHSMDTFGNPQYTTLDTSEAVVPDYARLVLRLLYLTVVKPNNPRTGPDPAPTARRPPAGFLTPSLWSQLAAQQLQNLETASPPILLPGSTGANPVIAEWDEAGQRIMSIAPVVPCPNNHQIGVSVRNVTSV